MRVLIRLAASLFFVWHAISGVLTGAVDTYFLHRIGYGSVVYYAANPGLFIFSIAGYVLFSVLFAVSAVRVLTGRHRSSHTGRWL